jgi:hypothetical protein
MYSSVACRSLPNQECTYSSYSYFVYLLSVVLSQTFFGTWLCCLLLDITKSKKSTYCILVVISCFSAVIMDYIGSKYPAMSDTDYNDYVDADRVTVVVFACIMGAFMHWGNKTGYVTMFITSNLQRLFEALYRLK